MKFAWILLLLIVGTIGAVEARKTPHITAIYLGDGSLDVGNNQFRKDSSPVIRCDYEPYGKVQFDGKPTGRCTGGYMMPDMLNIRFRMPPPKPYLQVQGDAVLPTSLDLASAESGLLSTTNKEVHVMSFHEQVEALLELKQRLSAKEIENSLAIISSGSQDIISQLPRVDNEVVDSMHKALREGLEKMHAAGFKHVIVLGVGPLQYVPRVNKTPGVKPEDVGALGDKYNAGIQDVLDEFNKLPDTRMTYADIYYNQAKRMLENGEGWGYTNIITPCCPNCLNGPENADSDRCRNPTLYAFWDDLHYGELMNVIVGQRLFSTSVMDMLKYMPNAFNHPAPPQSPPSPPESSPSPDSPTASPECDPDCECAPGPTPSIEPPARTWTITHILLITVGALLVIAGAFILICVLSRRR